MSMVFCVYIRFNALDWIHINASEIHIRRLMGLCFISFSDILTWYSFSCYFLQAKFQEFLGRKDLDKHLDADEAIVLGASLHAANLSDGIKLNRKLGMIDGSTYGFVLELDGPDLVKDENMDMLLVPRMKKMPIKVNIHLVDSALRRTILFLILK